MKNNTRGKKELPKEITGREDIRSELKELEQMINSLKVDFEQYFSGITPLAPDKAHNEVKSKIRRLMKAPFLDSGSSYKLRALDNRYKTFNTYWQRVMKQREQGVYSKDVFKAEMREKASQAEEFAETKKGAAQRSMEQLFDSYTNALKKTTGEKRNIDFNSFKKQLMLRAKSFKENNRGKKLTFKVVVKEGKVSVKAKVKGESK